jgi:hypothetical protein
MSLMKFQDPSEHEAVLGPLYATEAKDDIPIFGSDKFTSKKAQLLLNSKVKQALQSTANPVIDFLAPIGSEMGRELSSIGQTPKSLSDTFSKLQLEAQLEAWQGEKAKLKTPKRIFSSRERHDRTHFTNRDLAQSTGSKTGLLGHVMLQRALDGYLFNCKQNKAIVDDDVWLRDVWEWIEGNSNYILSDLPD